MLALIASLFRRPSFACTNTHEQSDTGPPPLPLSVSLPSPLSLSLSLSLARSLARLLDSLFLLLAASPCSAQVGVPAMVVFLNKCDAVEDPELIDLVEMVREEREYERERERERD